MKTKLIFIGLLISNYCAFCQEEKTELTHDIGFNTNIVLDGIFNSNSGLYNFIYKKQVTPNTAIRYGLIFNISLAPTPNSSTGSYSTRTSVYIAPSIGKEWQNQITKKWILYYGASIRPEFRNYSDEYSNFNNGNNTIQTSSSESYGVSFLPFLGLRFAINEKLYLATEATLNVNYYYQSSNSFITNQGVTTTTSNYGNHGLNANTGTAGGIFVFYRF